MDRKHSRETHERASRPKRKKFVNNVHTRKANKSFASTSAQKLSSTRDEEIIVDRRFLVGFTMIPHFVICKDCKQQVRFGESSIRGLGFKIAVQYKCNSKYINSCPLIDDKAYKINGKFIFVMRLLGVGKEDINLFCGLVDLSHGFANYLFYAVVENIYIAAKTIFDILKEKAVEEEKLKNSENSENGKPMAVEMGHGKREASIHYLESRPSSENKQAKKLTSF